MTLSDERLDELWEIAIRDDACKQLVPSDIRGLVIAARRLREVEAENAAWQKAFNTTGQHCDDCCCGRSWKALGITEYTGKSIPEHITAIKAKRDTLTADNARLQILLETLKDPENWGISEGYYEHGLPLWEGDGDPCEMIAAALASTPEQSDERNAALTADNARLREIADELANIAWMAVNGSVDGNRVDLNEKISGARTLIASTPEQSLKTEPDK